MDFKDLCSAIDRRLAGLFIAVSVDVVGPAATTSLVSPIPARPGRAVDVQGVVLSLSKILAQADAGLAVVITFDDVDSAATFAVVCGGAFFAHAAPVAPNLGLDLEGGQIPRLTVHEVASDDTLETPGDALVTWGEIKIGARAPGEVFHRSAVHLADSLICQTFPVASVRFDPPQTVWVIRKEA